MQNLLNNIARAPISNKVNFHIDRNTHPVSFPSHGPTQHDLDTITGALDWHHAWQGLTGRPKMPSRVWINSTQSHCPSSQSQADWNCIAISVDSVVLHQSTATLAAMKPLLLPENCFGSALSFLSFLVPNLEGDLVTLWFSSWAHCGISVQAPEQVEMAGHFWLHKPQFVSWSGWGRGAASRKFQEKRGQGPWEVVITNADPPCSRGLAGGSSFTGTSAASGSLPLRALGPRLSSPMAPPARLGPLDSFGRSKVELLSCSTLLHFLGISCSST